MQFEYDPENLIAEVSKRPGLWDYDHADYRAKNIRIKLWNEVVKELMHSDMNLTKGEMRELELQLQKKWKSIRDCFHKFVVNPARTRRPYIYSKHLQFLLKDKKLPKQAPIIRISVNSSESEEEEKQPRNAWKPKKKLKLSKNKEEFDDNNDTFDNQDDFSNDTSAPDETEAKALADIDSNQFAFANVDAIAKNEGEDPDKMFLLSLLPHLKSIPQEFRLNAKMELMQVLQQANYSISKLI